MVGPAGSTLEGEADTASDDVINKDVEVDNVPGNVVDERQQQQNQEECSDQKADGDDVWADFGHYTEGFNDGYGYGYADSDAESEYTPEEALEVLRRAAVRCSTAGYGYQLYCRGSSGGKSYRGSFENDSNACKSKVSLAEVATEGVEGGVVAACNFDGDRDGGFEDGVCRDSAAGVDGVMAPPPAAVGTARVSCDVTGAGVSRDSRDVEGGNSGVHGSSCDKKDGEYTLCWGI